MTFFLGTSEPSWLSRLRIPLLIAHRRLGRLRTGLPRARGAWALDSGAFGELAAHGQWTFTARSYTAAASRYADEIGRLAWAAPMDWPCEPGILRRTGLTVREHQQRTVKNFLDLRAIAPHLTWLPVLQGWTLDDYFDCIEVYAKAGVNLTAEPLVGLGSVCRRQHTSEIWGIVQALSCAGLRLHCFGVKLLALPHVGPLIESCDSAAWSYHARRRPALAGCIHRNCNSCPRYALRWRRRIISLFIKKERSACGKSSSPPSETHSAVGW